MATSSVQAKKKHIKAVHQKKKVFRPSDPVLGVFMWGINHTINELNTVRIPPMLMPDDFKASSKIKVDNHCYNKENLPSHFKFKEYCPLVFRNLREKFDISDTSYLSMMTSGPPAYGDTPGRSNSQFIMTHDRKYVIKTISSEEVALMHNIFKDYHRYVVECHGDTLLPQYLGMYKLTVEGTKTFIIVMRHILGSKLLVHKKFDLKGSTVSRQASDKEKEKELPTFKDNDFLNDNHKIYIGKDAKEKLMTRLKKDTEFLSGLNLMDYSLLVGIHDVEKAEAEANLLQQQMSVGSSGGADDALMEDGSEEEDELSPLGVDNGMGGTFTPPDSPCSKLMCSDGYDPLIDIYAIKSSEEAPQKEIYFMALIDVLTHWGAKKRAAHAAKTVKHGAGAEISTVKPEQYSKRFLEFIDRVIC